MSPLGMIGVQQRITEIQSRFAPPASFAAGLASAQAAFAGGAGGAGGAAGPGVAAAAGIPGAAGVPGAAGAAFTPPAPAGLAPVGPAPAGPAVAAPAPEQTYAAAAAPSPAGPGWAARLPAQAAQWLPAIESAAARAGIDPKLLAALVQQESGFRADARSHAGAIGLGQLMPGTARGLGVNPHDPAQNLQGAATYLRQQLDRFGSVELALAAYNAGPGRVAQAGGVPRITETQNYVNRVVTHYDTLRSI